MRWCSVRPAPKWHGVVTSRSLSFRFILLVSCLRSLSVARGWLWYASLGFYFLELLSILSSFLASFCGCCNALAALCYPRVWNNGTAIQYRYMQRSERYSVHDLCKRDVLNCIPKRDGCLRTSAFLGGTHKPHPANREYPTTYIVKFNSSFPLRRLAKILPCTVSNVSIQACIQRVCKAKKKENK